MEPKKRALIYKRRALISEAALTSEDCTNACLPNMPLIAGLSLEAVIDQEPDPVLAELKHHNIRPHSADQSLDLA